MSGGGLLLWGGGGTRPALAARARGGRVVAWPGADTRALAGEGIAFERAEDVLAGRLDEVPAAGRAFARVWARLPLVEGRSLRELVSWRSESLLWACEGFLGTASAGARCARGVELCLRLLEALDPDEVEASGLAGHDTLLLARSATQRGVLFHGEAGRPRPLPVDAGTSLPGRLQGLLGRLGAGHAPGGAARSADAGERSLLLVLLSRPEAAQDLAPLLEAARTDLWLQSDLLPTAGLGRFETPRVRTEVSRAEGELLALHARLRGTAALAASYLHRGVAFADLAQADLEALLCRRLPRAVHRLECAWELLRRARPALLLVEAPERDERRTLGMAAQAAGVPWVALRRADDEPEEPERADRGPQPSATLSVGPGQAQAAALIGLRQASRARVGAP